MSLSKTQIFLFFESGNYVKATRFFINNYILPIIGDTKLSEIDTRFIERYYQSLLKRRAVINPLNKTSKNEFVSSSTVRDVNKLLRNCFEQAVKWELMEKNPCTHATVPKHKSQENNNTVADEVDPELLAKVLANPEMRALLNSLAKTMM